MIPDDPWLTALQDDYNPDELDRLAKKQRQELIDSGALDEVSPVYKLRCAACSVLIGPGYVAHEVWHDPVEEQVICRSCARYRPRHGCYLILTSLEVRDLSIPEIARLIPRRIEEGATR